MYSYIFIYSHTSAILRAGEDIFAFFILRGFFQKRKTWRDSYPGNRF